MKRRRAQQSPIPKRPTRRVEQETQRLLFRHIDLRAAKGAFAFHPPLGGVRSKIEAAIFTSLGVRPGLPDVWCILDGKVHCIELKAPGGRLSPAQRETTAALKAAGAIVEVANSLDEALSHLETWKIIRGRTQ